MAMGVRSTKIRIRKLKTCHCGQRTTNSRCRSCLQKDIKEKYAKQDIRDNVLTKF